ncbi:MAG: ectonucleotide pyrophosphatase/phosphodiesterase [Opitutaceae bacterium]|nr:ectonucleotide pyrophosphatase/phosphodiesterase [Opitutaceae bacterium]
MPFRRLLLGLLLLFAVQARGEHSILILVSLDGFRWDYLEKYATETPCLHALAADGVRAERMISCFPTLTFPNHYTIVTGLRPEHHGIVNNTFYDPVLKAGFAYKQHACAIDGRWWGGEPIWITAVKQGRRSACMFWPGSEAEIAGARPTYYKTFDGRLTSAQRTDALLAWLSLPAGQRPGFCTLYFDVVDHAGHDYGPDAPETAGAVREVDAALDRLLAGLTTLGLRGATDIVIISDHGMTAIEDGHTVFLDDVIDLKAVQVECLGPQAGLRPLQGTPAALRAGLKRGLPASLHVCLREEIPGRFQYRDNPRIPPVLIFADEGWEVTTHADFAKRRKPEYGDHGYDSQLISMGATFIAAGPAFRHGVVLPPFENIQVYNLLCAVAGLHPAPNDGDNRLVRSTLISPSPQ